MNAGPTRRLPPPGRVDVWLAPVTAADAADVERLLPLLAPEEHARVQRFRFERDRLRSVATRAMVRCVLSRYAPIAPADWHFEFNAHGRPHVAARHARAAGLRFNVSHADALVVVAVTGGAEVGVDVEDTTRPATLGVADRFFTRGESAAMHALPPDERARRFWQLWTLKESYMKARGLGLALPLDSFSFDVDAAGAVRLVAPDDRAGRWQFRHLAPDARHLVALCVERDGSGDADVVVHGQGASSFAAAVHPDPEAEA